MALPSKVSTTIQEFRQDVLTRGGPQISGMYEVLFNAPYSDPIITYPLSVILPGRMFTFYDHDIWGPSRKVPYKRGYTQCHMSFIVYQDWEERTYMEKWMNTVLLHRPSNRAITASPNLPGGATTYTDFVNYLNGSGTINIQCLNTNKVKINKNIVLYESYPAAISQTTLASDGSGYPTYTVTFQFNNYEYI